MSEELEFPALVSIVDRIDGAPRDEVDAAIVECSARAHAPFVAVSERAIWLDMGRLLRRQRRRF